MKGPYLYYFIAAAALATMAAYAAYRVDRRCGYIGDELWPTDPATAIVIDDDGHPDGMRRMMALAKALGIRCCFAIIADEKANFQFYDSCRQEGYALLSHSLHHAEYANPYSPKFDGRLMDQDLAEAKRDLSAIGAATDALVYPGNCGKDYTSRRIARKHHRLCFSGNFLKTDYLLWPRAHRIPRFFIDGTDGFDKFKHHADLCRRRGLPIVVGTHSSGSDDWNEPQVRRCLTYLIELGYKFSTP